jgi:hypothetical protein
MSPDPESPSDKSSYSVDEIMERLRHDGSTGGSRRRRTMQQKVVTKKRRRYGLIFVFLAVSLILGTIVVFQMLNRARIEGEIFRLAVSQQLSSLMGAEVDCDRFKPNGLYSLASPNLRIKSSHGVLKDGLAKNLTASMTSTSFWRDEWDILTLGLDEATLTFRPLPTGPAGSTSLSSAPLATKDGFRMGLSSAPAVVTIHDIQCANLNLAWPGSAEKTNRIQGLTANGSYTQQTLKLQASGGRWTGGIWPDVPVDTITLTYTNGRVEIENARFRTGEKSQVRVSGPVEFTPEGPRGELEVKIDPVPLSDLMSPVWQRRLHGKYSPGTARYTITPAAQDEFSGDFTMDGLVLEKLPGLTALATFFKSQLYEKLEFRQFSAHFKRTNDALIVDKIRAVRHGECILTGEVMIKRDGALSGTLRLALNTIETGLPQFSGEQDGLDLIDFTLSGTEADPQDSLSEKFPAPAAPAEDK